MAAMRITVPHREPLRLELLGQKAAAELILTGKQRRLLAHTEPRIIRLACGRGDTADAAGQRQLDGLRVELGLATSSQLSAALVLGGYLPLTRVTEQQRQWLHAYARLPSRRQRDALAFALTGTEPLAAVAVGEATPHRLMLSVADTMHGLGIPSLPGLVVIALLAELM